MFGKLMTADAPVPIGTALIGWINHHPRDEWGLGYGVLRFRRTGVEVAWDGASIRSLPGNYRDKCEFEPVPRSGQ